MDTKFDSAITQQKSGEHNYVKGTSSKTVFQSVFIPRRPLIKCRLRSDLNVARFCPYWFHKCKWCDKRENKEIMYQMKAVSRRKKVTQKVKPIISQVTKLRAGPKKAMKQIGSPQKNLHQQVAKTSQKKGRKRNQHPQLVLQ